MRTIFTLNPLIIHHKLNALSFDLCEINPFGEVLADETHFQKIDDYTVRFTFPEPDGLALYKLWTIGLFAPAFFEQGMFEEYNWGYLPEPGPWGLGAFQLVEGNVRLWLAPKDRVVLEAYENYWDRRYPKVKRIIFENILIGDRKEAMRLCRETEGEVDIVSDIRPLDTLKVAASFQREHLVTIPISNPIHTISLVQIRFSGF